ncbi:MAG TPA: cytochrome C biosynthesis protein, partial [Prolixibacteraceae bacterium]|nr:cytochrome C biosynthesis protein [Prolixibacteraceae bacterium]
MRIPFDVEKNTWGKVDTVISSKSTGKSISFPKISPDGRYLMFTMSDHGYFTIHH